MILAVTYCSAKKDEGPGEIPAIDRYRSPRIQAVHDVSIVAGANFRILSGRYGLLQASQPIPHYDHLLGPEEVPRFTRFITEQLQRLEPERVVFFTHPIARDPNTTPYRQSLQQACDALGVALTIHELASEAPRPQDLIREF